MAFSLEELSENVTDTFKKGKLNIGSMFILGIIVIILLVLFRPKQGPQTIEAETIPDVELAGYPKIEDNFANFSAAMMDQVNATMGEWYSDISEQTTEVLDDNRKYVEDVVQGIEKQLGTDRETFEKKNSPEWTVGKGTTSTTPATAIDYSTNRAALKEEIERVQSVIQYRSSQGLDNTAQNNWLNKLRTL